MSNTTKALFLDLDGTFLDDAKRVSDENRDAMNELLRNGHKAIITTGRPLPSAIRQAEHIGLSGEGCYLIAYNGGVLYDTGARKLIFEKTIPLSFVRDIFSKANELGLHIQAYDRDNVLVEPRCDNEIVRYYCGRIEMSFRVIDSISSVTEEPAKLLLIDRTDRTKLNLVRAWIEEQFGNYLDSFFSSSEFLEVMAKNLNKGDGLRRLSEVLGIEIRDTVAIGDEENDISMIKAAGTGVAMANAIEEAKQAADYITAADNNHSGAAEAIRKFILETDDVQVIK